MKKILLTFALLLSLTLNMNAQTYHRYYRDEPRREYRHRPYREVRGEQYSPMGVFRLHVVGDLGTCDFPRVFWRYRPVHFSAGVMGEYQVGHVTSVGLGVEFYSTYYSAYYSGYYSYLRSLPIYGNLRFSTPTGPVRPYIEGRIGYAPSLNTFVYNGQEFRSGGLYTGGAIGLTIYNVNLAFGISAVDVMRYSAGYYVQDYVIDYSFRISFAFGRPY